MNILTPEQFISLKTSDTLVVLGSGSSINNITTEQWEKIASLNSIGFNWFCHHQFGPTFYIIREQANNKHRNVATETRKRLIRSIRKETYANTCLIVHDTKKHSSGSYNYACHHELFLQNGIIVKDVKPRRYIKHLNNNIFTSGVAHGKCTLTNILNVAIFLKYRQIVFAGIDLYDSRYFWLENNVSRKNILQKGRTYKHKHPIFRHTISLFTRVKSNFKNIELYTLNPKSLLKIILPTYTL